MSSSLSLIMRSSIYVQYDEAAVDFSNALDLKGPKHEDAVKELENVKVRARE